MVRAACHCTAVRFEVTELPNWVLDCNCTLCRRYGAIWAYPEAGKVKFVSGADATDTYVWGDRELAFHRCKECGCVTHMTALDANPPRIYGINTRLIPTLDPASVRLRQKDNGHTGFFWTRSDASPESSQHPKMPPPGPDDWR
jgi:hypothetical protein